MSAILMRRIRPHFSAAIHAAFPSSIEASEPQVYRCQTTDNSMDDGRKESSLKRRLPVVVLVECIRDRECDIARAVKDTLQATAMVTTKVKIGRGNDDATQRLDQILATIHPETPVFVVALFSASAMVQGYFATHPRCYDTGVAGVMLVYPTRSMHIGASVPTLTLNYLCESDERISDVGRCPNQILVLLPRRRERLDHSERLWIARAMLKFIHAVRNTMPTDETASLGIDCGTASFTTRKVMKLNSRL